MIKTENQIYADLISLVNSALKNFDINGWKVCQLFQPSKFTETEPFVYVSIARTSRRGAQYSKEKIEDGKLVHTELFREEIYVNIGAFKRSCAGNNADTLGANDILKRILSWVISPDGIACIMQLGYAIYNPSEIKQSNIKTDSENNSSLPSFDITFITEQSWESSIEDISGYKLKMKGI